MAWLPRSPVAPTTKQAQGQQRPHLQVVLPVTVGEVTPAPLHEPRVQADGGDLLERRHEAAAVLDATFVSTAPHKLKASPSNSGDQVTQGLCVGAVNRCRRPPPSTCSQLKRGHHSHLASALAPHVRSLLRGGLGPAKVRGGARHAPCNTQRSIPAQDTNAFTSDHRTSASKTAADGPSTTNQAHSHQHTLSHAPPFSSTLAVACSSATSRSWQFW